MNDVYASVDEYNKLTSEEQFADRLREDLGGYMRSRGILCTFGAVYTHSDGRVILLEDSFAQIPHDVLNSPHCNMRGYRLVHKPGTLAWVPLA